MPDITITVTDAEDFLIDAIAAHTKAVPAATPASIVLGAIREVLASWRQAPATDSDIPLYELQNGLQVSRETIAERVSQSGSA